MSPAAQVPEARQFDPRLEQQARLVDSALSVGTRLAESISAAMDSWLGGGLALRFSAAEIAYGPRPPEPGRISVGARQGACTPRMTADAGLFFRFYECMLSGSASGEPRPRPLGPTEAALGAALGARWFACMPGLQAGPKPAELWVLESEDAPPLQSTAWPLLRLVLCLADSPARRLEILAPLAMVEGASAAAGHAGAAPSRRLGQTPVPLQAVLGTVRLRLKELYELRPGDCVLLENGPADEAVVLLSREPVYRARPGRNGRHLAVQLLGPIDQKSGG